jgi:farnesyl diphosphate synthase
MTNLFPAIVPTAAALAVASLIVLASDVLPTFKSRVHFQFFFFGAAFAGAVVVLMGDDAHKDAVLGVWESFVALPTHVRFFLSLAIFAMTYFGAGLFVAAPSKSSEEVSTSSSSSAAVSSALASGKGLFQTPGSYDNHIGFEVPTTLPKDEKEFFEVMLDKLQKEILADIGQYYEMKEEALNWIDSMITYNVKGGKMNRGLACVDCFATLVRARENRELTNKERCQAAATGWALEFLQAFFLVADDIMDESVTRRGQPCWYRMPNIHMIAINDSFILETSVYKILKRYFGNEPYYYQLVDLFLETTRQTEFGQLMDLTSQPLSGDKDLTRFTMERYKTIVRYKTAFYSFYLPVAAGMIMAGITDPHAFQQAREILLIMGEYFQVQDDYLDCYGDPSVIGKIGTDIQDNKCCWLVVTALNKATPAQRQTLELNYGFKNKKKEAVIKKLYVEMGIEADFKAYEEQSYSDIQRLLANVKDIPHAVFTNFLDKIYKRAK